MHALISVRPAFPALAAASTPAPATADMLRDADSMVCAQYNGRVLFVVAANSTKMIVLTLNHVLLPCRSSRIALRIGSIDPSSSSVAAVRQAANQADLWQDMPPVDFETQRFAIAASCGWAPSRHWCVTVCIGLARSRTHCGVYFAVLLVVCGRVVATFAFALFIYLLGPSPSPSTPV